MKYQSDISNIRVQAPNLHETTAYGVALASYVYVKNLDLKSLSTSSKTLKTWSPNMSDQKRQNSLMSWNKALEKAKNWL